MEDALKETLSLSLVESSNKLGRETIWHYSPPQWVRQTISGLGVRRVESSEAVNAGHY